MTARRARKAPPLMVLLDMLMLWILALLAIPSEDGGLRYEFVGMPPGAVLFNVALPLDATQQEWKSFDFSSGGWVAGTQINPYGRENFLCSECAQFLPKNTEPSKSIMISLPRGMRERLRDAVFDACQHGECARTLYIDASGDVTTEPPETREPTNDA